MSASDPLTPEEVEAGAKAQGQRQINLIWECTQAGVAIAVTLSTLYALAGTGVVPSELSNAFFLVIGFYFGRTNHQRTGGVGGETAGPR